MDTQVACRATERLEQLLDKFVCVRAVEMEGVDLRRFQFDYDMSWSAFFLNADGTIYGRYGSRKGRSFDVGNGVSVEGFAKALEGALELHAAYPGNKASLVGKHGPPPHAREIRSFPLFKSRFAEAPPKGCAHCHYVWEALRSVPRSRRRPLPAHLMWPYPMPDRVGLVLDPDERATVRSVTRKSAASLAGFKAKDRITLFAGQPMLSISDVQWVLQHAKVPCDLPVEVDRGGERVQLTFHLAVGWRRGEDMTWRPSTGPMRPFGWQAATLAQRRAMKVPDGALCVLVKRLPPARAGQKAGLRVGDFIIEIDGSDESISENRWLELLYHEKVRGDRITLTVIHDGKRKKLQLKAP
jgi:serine protease Do